MPFGKTVLVFLLSVPEKARVSGVTPAPAELVSRHNEVWKGLHAAALFTGKLTKLPKQPVLTVLTQKSSHTLERGGDKNETVH